MADILILYSTTDGHTIKICNRLQQVIEAAGDRVTPVSYTHLDVYKRQGQVMDVDLERRHGRWVYEIKLLRPGGALVKLWVNASDGTILERHGRDTNPNR